MLRTDGGLVMFFFIGGEDFLIPVGCQPRDRADKHAIVREVADFVLLHRPDRVTCITEMRIATPDPSKPGVHAVDYPDRREGIAVEGISQTGETAKFGL